MRIRLRTPEGALAITLPENATVSDLFSQITEKTSIKSFDIKYGYPPKPLQLADTSSPLSKLDVKLDGEQLTISPREEDSTATQDASSVATEKVISGSPPFAGMTGKKAKEQISLQRKVMEDVPELPLPGRGATLGSFSLSVMPPPPSGGINLLLRYLLLI